MVSRVKRLKFISKEIVQDVLVRMRVMAIMMIIVIGDSLNKMQKIKLKVFLLSKKRIF